MTQLCQVTLPGPCTAAGMLNIQLVSLCTPWCLGALRWCCEHLQTIAILQIHSIRKVLSHNIKQHKKTRWKLDCGFHHHAMMGVHGLLHPGATSRRATSRALSGHQRVGTEEAPAQHAPITYLNHASSKAAETSSRILLCRPGRPRGPAKGHPSVQASLQMRNCCNLHIYQGLYAKPRRTTSSANCRATFAAVVAL